MAEAPRALAGAQADDHVDDLGEKAEDIDALESALRRAKGVTDRPTLIIVRTGKSTLVNGILLRSLMQKRGR